MEIYLIRHTTPLVDKGICYGQADLDVTETFIEEATIIKKYLPNNIAKVYSSPLQRCKKLADYLFTDTDLILANELKEISCGKWELQKWDDIPTAEIQPWMDNFVHVQIPEGESYLQLYKRVMDYFHTVATHTEPIAIVAHGGVLRSILAGITQTDLKDSFDAFSIKYGCVIKLSKQSNNFSHEILYNLTTQEKETHQPSYY